VVVVVTGASDDTTPSPAREITTHTSAEPTATTSSQAATPVAREREGLTSDILPAVRPASERTRRLPFRMTSILVVEDDEPIRRAVHRGLGDRGYAVASVSTGLAALEHVLAEAPSLVLLDLGLPDVGGLTLLSMIRAASQVPIIVITAQDDDPTMVKALDGGADDYIVKPFGTDQLAARIRAVLRRGARDATPAEPLKVGDLTVNERTRTATLSGEPLDLARKEFDLLLALVARAGEVVTKRELLAEVWQQPYGGSERTVDVHLSWLRRKLGESAADPRYLHSVRGVGVRLVAPDA
jgi:DNA-binding response OmpR family regulator